MNADKATYKAYGRSYPVREGFYQELTLAPDGIYDVIIAKEGLAPTRHEKAPFMVGRTGGVVVGTVRGPEGLAHMKTITRCQDGRFWIPTNWM